MSRLSNRQKVADLIVGVLTEQLPVSAALLKFPSDKFDKSIECAWHALIHFEADEDIRARDVEFCEEQNKFLFFISSLLREGKDLPINILKDYKIWHGGAPIPANEKSIWSKLAALFRFIHIN